MRFDRAKDVLEVAPHVPRNAAAERAVHFLNDHLAILHRPWRRPVEVAATPVTEPGSGDVRARHRDSTSSSSKK
jgi:hypothetical protein